MNKKIKSQNISDIIKWGTSLFLENNIENAKREIEWFLCHILNYNRIDLSLNYNHLVCPNKFDKIFSMVQRRISGEPFQLILGHAPFYGRNFFINKNVLIPRPETEVIIDILKKNNFCESLLDIGTGSGCIAITCALENLAKKIIATDISNHSLKMASKNITFFNINNIQLLHHNILKKNFKEKFNVVVSNPPYISTKDMKEIHSEILNYEPKIALSDGGDGLLFYHRFADNFDQLLHHKGFMLLEIGGNIQKDLVRSIFINKGLQISFYKDLQKDYRIIKVFK